MKTLLKTKTNLKAMIGLFCANYNNKDEVLYFDQFDDLLAYYQQNEDLRHYFQKLSNMPSLALWHQTFFDHSEIDNNDSIYSLYGDLCNKVNECESKSDLYEFSKTQKKWFHSISEIINDDLSCKKDEIKTLSSNIKNIENHLNALKDSISAIRNFLYDFEHALADSGTDFIIDKIKDAKDYIKESIYDSTIDRHYAISKEYESLEKSNKILLDFINDIYFKEIDFEIDSCIDDQIDDEKNV